MSDRQLAADVGTLLDALEEAKAIILRACSQGDTLAVAGATAAFASGVSWVTSAKVYHASGATEPLSPPIATLQDTMVAHEESESEDELDMLASDAAEIPDAQYVIEGSSSTTRLVDTAGLRRPEPAVMGRTHAEHVATDSADDGSEIPVEDICFREGYCSEDSTESLATPEEVSESANGIQGVPSMSPEPHLDPPAVPAGAPAWFIGTRTALVSLLNKRSPMTLDLRTRWVQVLKLWTLFESKTGFSQPYGRLPISVERPDEIGPWMRAHHRMNAVVVKDVQAFSQKWWLWWNDLNPDWRSRRGGFPIPGGTQQGPWTRLAKRGYSGFILVIISLYWWFPKGLGDPLLGSWSSALRDVSWVLSDIERWEHGAKKCTSTKRSGSINSAAAQASKRQKRSSA